MRILSTGAFLLVLAVPATAAASAQPEPPKGFLHCIGHRSDNKAIEHTITIYSKTARTDYYWIGGIEGRYELYSDDAHYVISVDQPGLDMPPGSHWFVVIAINRVTGSYEISDGATLFQQIKIEKGICTKMDRKL